MFDRKLMQDALLPVLVICFACVPVAACECAKPPLEPSIRHADAIFTAKVVAFRNEAKREYWVDWKFPFIHSLLSTSVYNPSYTSFQASRVWKGTIQQEFTLKSYGNICISAGFAVGREYLIYAHKKNGELSTETCTRTRLLEHASEDLAILGEGRLPEKNNQFTSILLAVSSLVLTIGVAIVAAWLWSRMGYMRTI